MTSYTDRRRSTQTRWPRKSPPRPEWLDLQVVSPWGTRVNLVDQAAQLAMEGYRD